MGGVPYSDPPAQRQSMVGVGVETLPPRFPKRLGFPSPGVVPAWR